MRNGVRQFMKGVGFRFSKQEKALRLLSEVSYTKIGSSNTDAYPYPIPLKIKERMQKIGFYGKSKYHETVRRVVQQKGKLLRTTFCALVEEISDPFLQELVDSDILWDKIETITPLGKQETFDLTIEGTHNFVANDMIVHNTHMLLETALQGIFNRKKTVFISLEMTDKGIASRLYKRIMAQAEKGGTFFYPVFDCALNQMGGCSKKERTNYIKLISVDGKKPKYDPTSRYRPCVACKGKKKEGYQFASWFEAVQKERMSYRSLKKGVEGFKFQWGDNLRLISYPKFSANISDINRDLDELVYSEDFSAELIVIDYANILAPEPEYRGFDEQEMIDTTWKKLGAMGPQRQALIVTAVHSNRATLDKKNIKASDTGRDIRIGHHVDALYTLNQTPEEKKDGVMRIGMAAHGWKDFNEFDQIKVLQQLDFSQAILDSGY